MVSLEGFLSDPIGYTFERMGRRLTPQQCQIASEVIMALGIVLFFGGIALASTSSLWTSSLVPLMSGVSLMTLFPLMLGAGLSSYSRAIGERS